MARLPRIQIPAPKPKKGGTDAANVDASGTANLLEELRSDAPAPAISPEEAARVTADVGPVQTARRQQLAKEPKRGAYRNINLSNIESGGDVDEFLDAVSWETQNAGYKPQPLSEVEAKAAAMDAPEIGAMIKGKQGGLLNAEQMLKARQTMVASAERIMRKSRDITKRRQHGGVTNKELLDFRRDIERHKALQSAVQGHIRDTARTLNALRIPAGDMGDEMVLQALGAAGGRDSMFEMARTLASKKDLSAVSKAVDRGWFAKGVDALIHMRTMGLLSGPATHVKNMTGNALVNMWSIPERVAGAAVGTVRNTGRRVLGMTPTEQVRWGEAGYMMLGEVMAMRDAIRLAARAAKTNRSEFGASKLTASETGDEFMDPISSQAMGVDPDSWRGKTFDYLGAAVSLPGRALLAEDEFFKTLAFRKELYAQSYRQAVNEGAENIPERMTQIMSGMDEEAILRVMSDAPDEVAQQAIKLEHEIMQNAYSAAYKQAQYETFTDPLEWDMATGFARVRQNPGMRIIVPFYNTIANIMSYALERSPLAPLAPKWRADLMAGGIRTDMAVARAGMGTAAAFYMASLTTEGRLTGSGPDNPAIKRAWREEGWQPYSVKFVKDDGTIEWVSYRGMEPATSMLSTVATIFDAYALTTSAKKREHIVAGAVMAFGESFMDQTFLMGFSDLLDVLDSNDPDRFRKWMNSNAASFIPYSSALRTARRTLPESMGGDPYKRNVYTGPFITLENTIKNMLPWMSKDVPYQRNMWGGVPSYEEKWGWDWLSPFTVTRYKNDKATQEIAAQGVNVSRPRRTFQIQGRVIDIYEIPHKDGVGWAMDSWAQMLGQERKKAVDKMVNSTKYENAPDAETGFATEGTRAQLLEMALREGNKKARARFFKAYEQEIKTMLRDPSTKDVVPPMPPGAKRQVTPRPLSDKSRF